MRAIEFLRSVGPNGQPDTLAGESASARITSPLREWSSFVSNGLCQAVSDTASALVLPPQGGVAE